MRFVCHVQVLALACSSTPGTRCARIARMRTIIFAFVVAGALAINSSATTLEEAAVASFTDDRIEVTGHVEAKHSEWRGGRILTRVTLQLESNGSRIEFNVPGGSVHGIAMRVTGMPQFEVGERTRVKLRATGSGLHFLGLESGKVVLP
jgi:hypothetical protein